MLQIPKLVIKQSKICQKYDYTLTELHSTLQRIKNDEFMSGFKSTIGPLTNPAS